MNFTLEIDALGTLNFIDHDGTVYPNIRPVRSFPISDPKTGLSLMSQDGKELAWIERLDSLEPNLQKIIPKYSR